MIEQASLKGARSGNVEVSTKCANFFIAHPGGTSDDVLRLVDLVKSQVADRMGVELALAIDVW